MQLTLPERADGLTEFEAVKQEIQSILIDGTNLVVVDKTINVDMRRDGIAGPIVKEYLAGLDNSIIHVKAISDVNAKENSIECDGYRITGVDVKALNENAIGSFHETMQREVTNSIFNLLLSKGKSFESLGVKVSIFDTGDAKQMGNEYPFKFIADFGDGLKVHKAFLSWSHNHFYSATCASCQAGVQNLIRAVDFFQNRLVLPEGQKKGESKVYELPSGSKVIIFNSDSVNHIATGKKTSLQDLVDWMAQMFIGTIEMAHVNHLQIRIDEQVVSAKGTDE